MIDHTLEVINAITPSQWFAIGTFLASIPLVIGVVAWVKKHHLKVKGEELWSGFVVLNVTVWSFILTAVDAISANLSQITHIGSLIPVIAPYVASYGPALTTAVLVIHTIATALRKWWVDRKNHEPITNQNLPTFNEVPAVTSQLTVSGQPSSSMGTQAVGMEVSAPPENLFQ